MLCSKCGSENTDDSMFCNKCGAGLIEENALDKTTDFEELEEQKETSSNKIKNFGYKIKKITMVGLTHVKAFIEKLKIGFAQNKKKYTGFSILTLLLIVGIMAGALYYNSPIKKIERLYDNEEYTQAQAVYSETISQENDVGNREKLNSHLKEFFNKIAAKTLRDYTDKKIDYQTAVTGLNNIKTFWVAESEATTTLAKIDALRDSRSFYESGLKNISNKNYIEGVEELDKVIKDDPNFDDAKKQISKVLPNFKKQGLLEAENAYKKSDYQGALNSIELLSKYFKNDSEIETKLEFYKAENEKAIELEKQRKEARKQELLARTTANYDDMKELTIIVPKGYSTRYNNVSEGINIYPEININSSGKASFYIVAGFQQSDWIFFKRIIFDADGDKFTWNASGFGDTQTQVIWGGIAEWMGKAAADAETVDALKEFNFDDNGVLSSELIQQMTKISNANVAKMRFQGQGYRDHVLTNNEKENLKTFIELYGCYEH